jgi:hypothetical protein
MFRHPSTSIQNESPISTTFSKQNCPKTPADIGVLYDASDGNTHFFDGIKVIRVNYFASPASSFKACTIIAAQRQHVSSIHLLQHGCETSESEDIALLRRRDLPRRVFWI